MEMRAGCPYFPETVSLDLLTVKRKGKGGEGEL